MADMSGSSERPDFGVAQSIANPADGEGSVNSEVASRQFEPQPVSTMSRRRFLGRSALVGALTAAAFAGAGWLLRPDNGGSDNDGEGQNPVQPGGGLPVGGESTPTPKASGQLNTGIPSPEAKKEAPFKYELGFRTEIEGPDVTVVIGIEKSVTERTENNTCSINNVTSSACPPIHSVELSDEYLREIAPEQFPNGMSKQEMIQRVNDAALLGHLFFLNNLQEFKDLDLLGLKEILHQKKSLIYYNPVADAYVNVAEPMYFIITNKHNDERGIKSSSSSYALEEHEGSLIVEMFHVASFGMKSSSPAHPDAFQLPYAMARGLVIGADSTSASENMVSVRDELVPYIIDNTAAGFIVMK